jgi:hypothetical protein
MFYVHIHRPPVKHRKLSRSTCSTCGKPRWMVCFFYEWYGWLVTCLGCGEMWEDGERLERPFMPRWQEENKRNARKHWRESDT